MAEEAGEDADLALAVGLLAIGDASPPEAAETAGVSRWELETAVEEAGLAGPLGLDEKSDVAADIDDLLDDGP